VFSSFFFDFPTKTSKKNGGKGIKSVRFFSWMDENRRCSQEFYHTFNLVENSKAKFL
jgi:hypothetical protein